MSNNNIPTAREKYTESKVLIEGRVDEYLKKYPPVIKERTVRIEANTELYFAFFGKTPEKMHPRLLEYVEREFANYIADKSDSEYSYDVKGTYCKSSFITLTPNKKFSFGMFGERNS